MGGVIITTLIDTTKVFILFTIAQTVFTNINYYQVNHIKPTFKDLALYNLYLIGIIWAVNMLVELTFTWGMINYKLPVWVVTILYWAAAVIPTLVMAYFWFGQLPNLKQILGLCLVIFGIILVSLK